MEVEYSLGKDDWYALYMYHWERTSRWTKPGSQRIVFWVKLLFVIPLVVLQLALIGLFALLTYEGMEWPLKPIEIGPILLLTITLTILVATLFPLERLHRLRSRKVALNLEKAIKKGALLPGQRVRLVIDAAGITEYIEHRRSKSGVEIFIRQESKVPWSCVKAIDVVREHAFIGMVEHQYAVLPKSAFESEQQFLEYLEAAGRLRAHYSNQAS